MPAKASDWLEAQRIVMGGAAPPKTAPAKIPTVETVPAPVVVQKPGVFATLWNLLRGKDINVQAKADKPRPGLHPNGDPALWDQQDMLSKKGYT